MPPCEVHLVFFAWLNPQRHKPRLAQQYLRALAAFPWPANVHLHVVLTGDAGQRHTLVTWLFTGAPWRPASVEQHEGNEFEYRGIRKVHDLARALPPEAWVGYCHNRGESHGANLTPFDQRLLRIVFGDWTQLQRAQQTECPDADAMAAVYAGDQFPWFNFWWARAGYLREVEVPQPQPVWRHYYEEWLAHHPSRKPRIFGVLCTAPVSPHTALWSIDTAAVQPSLPRRRARSATG